MRSRPDRSGSPMRTTLALRQGFETDLTGGPDGSSAQFLKTCSISGVEVLAQR